MNCNLTYKQVLGSSDVTEILGGMALDHIESLDSNHDNFSIRTVLNSTATLNSEALKASNLMGSAYDKLEVLDRMTSYDIGLDEAMDADMAAFDHDNNGKLCMGEMIAYHHSLREKKKKQEREEEEMLLVVNQPMTEITHEDAENIKQLFNTFLDIICDGKKLESEHPEAKVKTGVDHEIHHVMNSRDMFCSNKNVVESGSFLKFAA